MPDNVNLSNPVSTNTTINKPLTLKEPPQINAIDPTKVTQPNTNKQGEQNSNFDFLMSRNSVFSKFVEQLRQTPELSQTLQKIMFDLFSRQEAVSSSRPLSAFMKQLSSAMQMDSKDILQNILFQSNNQTKFSGSVFDIFRQLSSQYPESDFTFHLSSLLKAYDGVFSAPNTMNAIVQDLDNIIQQMPKSYASKLQPLLNELLPEQSPNSVDINLVILKDKILPLLSEYVSATNDFGKTRDQITLLVHNLARLNISSKEDLVEKFSTLMDCCRYELNLPSEKIDHIQQLFVKCLSDAVKKPENEFFDSMLKLLSEGTKQSTSNLSQSMYKEICSSLLMDNSVYMPFHHIFLPVNYQGQFMFSEIWIEKDDDSKSNQGYSLPNPTKLYLTFDIKNLGYFEATIELLQSKAKIKLSCPPSLSSSSKDIRDKISQIFAQKGLTAESVELTSDNTPKISLQILKKVYERRNAIDVSI